MKGVCSSLIATEIIPNFPAVLRTIIDILLNGIITQDKIGFVIMSLRNERTKMATNEIGKKKHDHFPAFPPT